LPAIKADISALLANEAFKDLLLDLPELNFRLLGMLSSTAPTAKNPQEEVGYDEEDDEPHPYSEYSTYGRGRRLGEWWSGIVAIWEIGSVGKMDNDVEVASRGSERNCAACEVLVFGRGGSVDQPYRKLLSKSLWGYWNVANFAHATTWPDGDPYHPCPY
jgi:hypothetical protein